MPKVSLYHSLSDYLSLSNVTMTAKQTKLAKLLIEAAHKDDDIHYILAHGQTGKTFVVEQVMKYLGDIKE